MKYVVQLNEQAVVYGPFDDADVATRFAEFLTAEVDPATVRPVANPVGELLAWRDTVKEIAADQYAGADVAPIVAAHVLFHFDAGGYEAGSFTKALIDLIARADPHNRARLAAGHPAYVQAVNLAQNHENGIHVLKTIAGGAA